MRVQSGIRFGSAAALALPARTAWVPGGITERIAESAGETSRAMKDALTAGQRAATYWTPHANSAALIGSGFLLMKATTIFAYVAPGLLVDMALGKVDHSRFGGLLQGAVALFGVNVGANVMTTRLIARTNERITNSIRYEMFERLQKLSLDYYDRRQSGDIVARFTSDLTELEQLLGSALPDATHAAAGLLIGIPLAFILQWELALITLLAFPLVVLGSAQMTPRAINATLERKEAQGKTAAWLQEQMSVQPIVKAFGLETESLGRFKKQITDLGAKSERAQLLSMFIAMMSRQGGLLSQTIVLGVGGMFFLTGTMTLGALVSYLALLTRLNNDLYDILKKPLPALISASAAFKRIDDILASQPDIVDAPSATELPRLEREIRFSNVRFGYNGGAPKIEKISLTIPAGAWIVLVGASGSGKTTLLKLLLRLYEVRGGEISLDGHDIRAVTQSSLRAQMGIVFQDSLLLNTTIRQNIRLGKLNATDAEIENAARAAEIHRYIISLPKGYDTTIGELGGQLSGGERQRMAIARALVRDPAVLLLDEPTSALDAKTEAALMKTIAKLARRRTVILATHRLATAQTADQIYVLDGGKLMEQGTHSELLAQSGLYEKLWKTQQNGHAEEKISRKRKKK